MSWRCLFTAVDAPDNGGTEVLRAQGKIGLLTAGPVEEFLAKQFLGREVELVFFEDQLVRRLLTFLSQCQFGRRLLPFFTREQLCRRLLHNSRNVVGGLDEAAHRQ
jgi:hypothetical protein